jgi:mono/diheme cytochrome c family protein
MTRSKTLCALAIATLALAATGSARAETRSELGKVEYGSNCAMCHGPTGKGDGFYTQYLKMPVPDLTTIARRNGGVFPADRLIEVIDGRQALKGHGPRGMPIWGASYTEQANDYYRGMGFSGEQYVRARILALVDYLYSLQAN